LLTCRYSLLQFACVAMLTSGAVSATFAEAIVGDTAKAAAAAGASSISGAFANATACLNCPENAVPHMGALARQAQEAAATGAAAVAAAASSAAADAASSWFMIVWLMGVGMLATVLILQTILGNYQAWVADKYGRAPNEGMFYMHAFSLPMFMLTLPDMLQHAALWSQSPATGTIMSSLLESASLPGASLTSYVWSTLAYTLSIPLHGVPIMWTYVACNVLSQFVCIKGVYNLTPIADPLTVNVTLTVRKFVSLLLSIWVFNNTFTVAHWIGAVLVFGGALWYGQLPAPPKPQVGGSSGGPAGSAQLVPLSSGAAADSSSSGGDAGGASGGAGGGGSKGDGSPRFDRHGDGDDLESRRSGVTPSSAGDAVFSSAVAAGGGAVHHRAGHRGTSADADRVDRELGVAHSPGTVARRSVLAASSHGSGPS